MQTQNQNTSCRKLWSCFNFHPDVPDICSACLNGKHQEDIDGHLGEQPRCSRIQASDHGSPLAKKAKELQQGGYLVEVQPGAAGRVTLVWIRYVCECRNDRESVSKASAWLAGPGHMPLVRGAPTRAAMSWTSASQIAARTVSRRRTQNIRKSKSKNTATLWAWWIRAPTQPWLRRFAHVPHIAWCSLNSLLGCPRDA